MARQTRGRGARLRKSWEASLGFDQAAISTTQAELGGFTIGEGTIGDTTVLRVRGNILVAASPNAAADSDILGLGLIVVTESARTAGGAALPGPLNDVGNDGWFWHQFVPLDAVILTAGIAELGGTVVRVEIDAKAMRRVPTDYAVVLVAELQTGDMGSVNVTGQFRILFGS